MAEIEPSPASLDENRLTRAERMAAYDRALARSEAALSGGTWRGRVPTRRGVGERRHGTPFHATPEVFFQQAGATEFRLPEERFVLGAGEVGLVSAGLPHGERTLGAEGDFLTLVLMFQAEGFSLHFCTAGARRSVRAHAIDRVAGPGARRVEAHLAEIVALREEGVGEAEPVMRAWWAVVLARIRRELARPAEGVGEDAPPLVARCRDLVQLHLAEPALNVAWLAGRLGCTADHLSRVYRRAMGRTLIGAIHEARMAQAKRYLSERGEQAMRINEVAASCGYAVQSHFNRVFRAQTGRTPGAWRSGAAG